MKCHWLHYVHHETCKCVSNMYSPICFFVWRFATGKFYPVPLCIWVSDGTKSLHNSMPKNHRWSLMTFLFFNCLKNYFTGKYIGIFPWNEFVWSKFTSAYTMGQWVGNSCVIIRSFSKPIDITNSMPRSVSGFCSRSEAQPSECYYHVSILLLCWILRDNGSRLGLDIEFIQVWIVHKST